MTYNTQPSYSAKDSARMKYLLDRERSLVDFTNRIPDKVIEKERLPWGLYGYTYLGHNKMWLNELLDQTQEKKEETELHEAIHTESEYETRRNTKWMLDVDESKLKKEIIKKFDLS